MKRIVIYECYDFEITLRELMFSLIIVLFMMTLGFLISEKISSGADEKRQEYEQAAKIDGDKELFEYGMRTDVGNAFVYGTLKAEDPISLPEIDGRYAYIRRVKERYTKHTRQVTHSDGKRTWTTTEIYYTWDAVGREDFTCTEISFLDHRFNYGKIPFPQAKYLTTINVSSNVRYLYSVCSTEYKGTIYTKLANKTISNTEFIDGMGLNEAVEHKSNMANGTVIMFWIIWIAVIVGAVFGFCYMDNRWVED